MKAKDFFSCLVGVFCYLCRFFKAVWRKQRFVIPEHEMEGRVPFFLTPEHKTKWDALYRREPGAAEVPFDYHSVVAARVLFGFLSQLGVNFKNVLFLRHQTAFASENVRVFWVGKRYFLTFRLEKIIEIREDRVVLVFENVAKKSTSPDPVTITRDYILVKNVNGRDMETIRSSRYYTTDGSAQLNGLSKTTSEFNVHDETIRQTKLRYSRDAGLRFGLLSGDLNFLHISKLFARMCGFPRPFAQGLFSSNYAISALSEAVGTPVTEIDVTFVNPVFLDQTVALKFTGDFFEIQDDRGKVLCLGNYKTDESELEKSRVKRAV